MLAMRLPCEMRLPPCNQSKRVSKKCAEVRLVSTCRPVARTVYPLIGSSLTGLPFGLLVAGLCFSCLVVTQLPCLNRRFVGMFLADGHKGAQHPFHILSELFCKPGE